MDQAIVFGRHDHLVGIVSHPIDAAAGNDLATILLTPGMLHHVGPFRMHVDLARELSTRGIRSLRFDLSGIGESLGIGSAGTSIERAAAETSDAMDWMEKQYGCKRFVLFGLCSGADDSIHTALNDPRVAGFVAIDGLGYRTNRFYFHRVLSHYLPRLFSPRKWVQLVRRAFARGFTVPRTLQIGTDVREFPERDQAAQQLQTLIDRGGLMHFVYTGGIAEYYNYENQFFEMLPEVDFGEAVSTNYFPHMDHVALLCEDREALVSHVAEKIVTMKETIIDSDENRTNSDILMPVCYPVASGEGIMA